MSKSLIFNRVMAEIELIPEDRLKEIYDFIHYFRIGIEKAGENRKNIIQFAGCWEDMTREEFINFSEEIRHRRSQAFLRRRTDETGNG